MIDRLMTWWLGRRVRAQQRARAAQPPTPLRFPFELGADIATVRAEIERQYASDGGLDDVASTGSGRTDRRRMYSLERPGGACVNVAYAYRAQDGVVWSIHVAHAAPISSGDVGAISLLAKADHVRRTLGEPVWTRQEASIISAALWLAGEFGYRVEWYSETYDDIAGYHQGGELCSVDWFSRALAPTGYHTENAD